MDKKVDKEMAKVDKEVARQREERLMFATSAGKIVALQRAIAGWSKPSGELFCFIPSFFKFVQAVLKSPCRTETVTERLEEGWAKVSERVVEVVTEEVFVTFFGPFLILIIRFLTLFQNYW